MNNLDITANDLQEKVLKSNSAYNLIKNLKVNEVAQ